MNVLTPTPTFLVTSGSAVQTSGSNVLWEIALAFAPTILAFVVAFVAYFIYRFGKQRKLFRFLGVDQSARQTIVYLSSLLIPPFHSVGFDGQPRSYQGLAVPIGELNIGSRLGKELDIDAFKNLPPIIRNSLQTKYAFFRPLTLNFRASPMNEAEIDFSTRSMITTGSQGYNVMTYYCVAHNLPQLQICNNGSAIQVMKGRNIGEIIRPPSAQHDIAILERLIDHTHDDATIIIAAGLGVIGTVGAVHFLIDHWIDEDKKYQGREFALVLQFGPVGNISESDLLKGSVIRRFPE